MPGSLYTEAITTADHAAFARIIDAIAESTKLVHIDWEHPLVLQTDASAIAASAVLLTGPLTALRPFCFVSRKFNAQEARWNVTEKEGFAVKWAVEKFEELLWSRPFIVETDHLNLVHCWNSTNTKIQRWCDYLSQFRFKILNIPRVSNVIADEL